MKSQCDILLSKALSETDKPKINACGGKTMGNFLAIITLIAAEVPDQLEPVVSRISELVYTVVIPIVFVGLGIMFLFLGIRAGGGIAVADTPEAKKKAVSRLMWLLGGMVLCFVLAFAMPYIIRQLTALFPAPSN
jgi:hypothetical protein